MLKAELLREAQEHCDSSFAKPDNLGSKYTAWNSMATLLGKGLVLRQGNPAKYEVQLLRLRGRIKEHKSDSYGFVKVFVNR